MRRDVLLAGAIALLTLTMVAGATAVPGVLSEPTEDVRPSHLDLRETYVDARDVTGETVTLSLTSARRATRSTRTAPTPVAPPSSTSNGGR